VSATEKSRDRLWRTALRIVVVLIAVSAGFAVAWLRHGDAVELRETIRQQDDRIVELQKEREELVIRGIQRMGRCVGELQRCEQKRAELGLSAPTSSK
jgi:hypothetical protein